MLGIIGAMDQEVSILKEKMEFIFQCVKYLIRFRNVWNRH